MIIGEFKCKDCENIFDDDIKKEKHICNKCESKNTFRFFGNQPTSAILRGGGFTKNIT